MCYECGKKDHMIKDCPIAKKKGKHPVPGHWLKKIEEVDKTQEDADGTLTDEGEVEEIQDFVEGDSQYFCTKCVSCIVKAIFQSMVSSRAGLDIFGSMLLTWDISGVSCDVRYIYFWNQQFI
jgi:hypothetical protein